LHGPALLDRVLFQSLLYLRKVSIPAQCCLAE
jgi:hypothetical protein